MDAVAAHALRSPGPRLAGEDQPGDIAAARRGEANAAGSPPVASHAGSMLIAVMALMVIAVATG